MIVTIRLQHLLDDKNMSQRELARLTETKQPTINKMCQNTLLHFPLETLAKICAVLECGICDILTLEEGETIDHN